MSTEDRNLLPFSALVGQEKLKTALLMSAVNPRLQGVLIRGEKGTSKSTAARGLARLLPLVRVIEGCRFGCVADRPESWCADCLAGGGTQVERRPRFVTLPLGVTEDRLLGSIDIEHALRHGEQKFMPGLLAQVNQGVLYVDEVNLLDDHIVDLLLDTAVTGVNLVAREGITFSHPAEFVLVGTMNPDEGELRPQLTDRFGLCVEIRSLQNPDARAEVVARQLQFEADPETFRAAWSEEELALTRKISLAREGLAKIRIDHRWCEAAARLALSVGVDGHRADILLVKGAATRAALEGRVAIQPEDLEVAATVVLPHRLRRNPFEEQPISEEDIRDFAREAARTTQARPEKKNAAALAEAGSDSPDAGPAMGHNRHPSMGARVTSFGNHRPMETEPPEGLLARGLWADQDFTGDVLPLEEDSIPPVTGVPTAGARTLGARRRKSVRDAVSDIPFRGRYTRATPASGVLSDLAWDAIFRSSAYRQRHRCASDGLAFELGTDELLRRVRIQKPGRLLLLVVDISGSMASRLMVLAKNIALQVIRDAYIKRDQVAMIAFRQRSAEVLFWPTNQVELVRRALNVLPLGGTTPLGMGLERAHRVLATLRSRAPGRQEIMILISDGCANTGRRPGREVLLAEVEAAARALTGIQGLQIVFLDTTAGGKHDAPARRLTRQLRAQRMQLSKLCQSGRDPVHELTKSLDLSRII